MKTLISLKSRLPALEARVGGISVPVEEALTKLAARYVRLGLQMPKVHAWRWNKLADSAVGGYDVEDLAATFGMSQNLESLLLVAAFAAAQGPGSCGFHLDLLTDLTSTHAASADIPGAAKPPGWRLNNCNMKASESPAWC